MKDTISTPPDPVPPRAPMRLRVGDDVHGSIEHDTKGNPVIVLIAPLELDESR